MVTETYYSLQVNSWLKKYGINLDKLIKLWSEQQGRCRICGCEMKWCYLKEFKNGELREKERIRCKNSPITKKMNIDHDHNTHKVRGLLCDWCNLHLSTFEKYPEQTAKYFCYELKRLE